MDETTRQLREAYADRAAGRLERAAAGLRAVLRARPDLPEAVLALMDLLESDGRAAEALLLLEDAAGREAVPRVLLALADRLHARGQLGRAAQTYARVLAQDATLTEAWWGLACAQAARGDHPAAVAAFRRLVALRPEDGQALTNLGRSLFMLGEVDEALAAFRAALTHLDGQAASTPLLNMATIIPGSPAATHADIVAARRAWAATVRASPPAPAPPARSRPRAHGRARLGYVSAFFGSRNWMKPVWAVLAQHDRERFELHVLSDGPTASASGYPRDAADHLHDVSTLTNEQLARLVSELAIDLLVDLNGYSRPARLELFLLRPAPIQVSWFNQFAPSGLDGAFDCVIGDAHVIPPEEESWYTEQVARVEGCSYLSFHVAYPVPDVAPLPCRPSGSLTFGCLAPLYKLGPWVLQAWARILADSPGTRLLLRNEQLGSPEVRAWLRERFAQLGVGEERLELQGAAEHYDFLETYARVDVALDPFPYNGGTTTAEALWQGVPVLAFTGDRWVARTSSSLLREAGLHEWVAPDLESYVARAIELAADPATPARLDELRRTMRARLRASGACDAARLAHELERIYEDMLRA